jgi:hypothetical protein
MKAVGVAELANIRRPLHTLLPKSAHLSLYQYAPRCTLWFSISTAQQIPVPIKVFVQLKKLEKGIQIFDSF